MEALTIWDAILTIGLAFVAGVSSFVVVRLLLYLIFDKSLNCPPHDWKFLPNKRDNNIVRYMCRKCGRVV